MAEIVAIGRIRAKPGMEGEVEEILKGIVGQVHGEQGCLLYALHRSTSDHCEFVMIERWASTQALDAHSAQPMVQEFIGRAGDLLDGEPSLSVLEALPAGQAAQGRL